jgi:hypothetical protein
MQLLQQIFSLSRKTSEKFHEGSSSVATFFKILFMEVTKTAHKNATVVTIANGILGPL